MPARLPGNYAASTASCSGCIGAGPYNPPPMRTLILGLDGGTFDVFRPLVDAGRMPNLQALWQRSACLPLDSTEPFITPTAWYTFLTGCDPARHGVLDYRYYDHQADAVRLNHAQRTSLPTLFDVAERSGPVVSL